MTGINPVGTKKIRDLLLILHLTLGVLRKSPDVPGIGWVWKLSVNLLTGKLSSYSRIQGFLSLLPEHPSKRTTSR